MRRADRGQRAKAAGLTRRPKSQEAPHKDRSGEDAGIIATINNLEHSYNDLLLCHPAVVLSFTFSNFTDHVITLKNV